MKKRVIRKEAKAAKREYGSIERALKQIGPSVDVPVVAKNWKDVVRLMRRRQEIWDEAAALVIGLNALDRLRKPDTT